MWLNWHPNDFECTWSECCKVVPQNAVCTADLSLVLSASAFIFVLLCWCCCHFSFEEYSWIFDTTEWISDNNEIILSGVVWVRV